MTKAIWVVPIFLFFLLITAPMLTMPRDMWDGTIIEYASIINNFSGLKAYFFESTWFLQYPLSMGVIKIAQFLNISYKNFNALLVFGLMAIFLREVFYIAYYKIHLSRSATYFSLMLVATFSTWGVLYSSIMTFHFCCIVIGLFAVRKIHKRTIQTILIGYFTLLVSLSLQSQLVYLPALSYFYDLARQNHKMYFRMLIPSKETILIFFSCIIVFFVVKTFFPPQGLYENYNSIVIHSPKDLFIMLIASIRLSTYLIPALVIIGLIFFIITILDKNIISISKEYSKHYLFLLIGLFVLFFAGLFPYAAVGKSSHFLDISDWHNRQAILLALPASLLTALSFQILYDVCSNKLMRIFVVTGGTILLMIQISLLASNLVYKLNRQIFVTQLESLIHSISDKITPGILEIIGSEIPGPQIREYEANFSMHKATGRADWWTRVGEQEDIKFMIPCFIKSNRNYQIKYIFNYTPSNKNNHTVIIINTSGFMGGYDALANVFGINPPGLVELSKIDSKKVDFEQINAMCN